MKRTFPLLSLLLAANLLLGACGTADNESAIATAVALTVQAQATPTTEILPSATSPDTGTVLTSTAPAATPTPNPSVSYANCMAAVLVSETPPDKTVFVAGKSFLKTWHIQNNSNCTWTPDYKIIFWNGDLMGGSYNYNFPQSLPPGESADVSILLAAPEAAGTYKGEWKLQTPDGQNFGMGAYQSPMWTEIVVISANETPTYGITSVTYNLERSPLIGCNTNNWYTVTAHVSFSGPMNEVILQFQHSDGFKSSKIKLEITEPSTLDFQEEWKFYIADAQGPKWIRLTQVFPTYIEFDKVNFTFECK
jgi:hypothetical protein